MGFIVKGVKSVVKLAGKAVKAVGKILGPIVGMFGKKKPAKTSSNLRLNKDLTPEAYRKIVFGQTASGLDLRFWQVWGTNGTNYDEVIALACHRIEAALGLYFEDELAIDNAGTIQTKFFGVVTRDVRLGAYNQTAMSVGDGTQWNASSTFDGVAHMKLAWTPTEKTLPNGVPSRYTQIVKGAPVYDPRRDSTAGGSGAHRINDRTTWDYAATDANGVPIGRNNALQVLWYLLGWYVPNKQTGELVLVAGRGIEPSDINIATFITGANNCEAAGYYTDMILSTEDAHTSNEDKMTAGGLIAQLIDTGGLWSYYANVDDTANIALEITDDDVLRGGSVTWNEYQGISEQYQQVSGKFIDPSSNSLYQLNGYPMVRDANYENLTGLKRRKTQDFEVVQDVILAQKLARLLLNMGQYQAEFAAPFLYRSLKAQAWSIVRFTSNRFGWSKLFRVHRYDITEDNGIEMLLKEIHPSIWGAGSVQQPIPPSAGVKYDPRQEVIATGIGWAAQTVGNGAGSAQDGVIFFWSKPPANVKYTEVRYRKVGEVYWQSASPYKGDSFVSVVPIVSGAQYEFQVRHVSIHEVDGPWMPQPAQVFFGGTNSQMPWDYVSDPNATRPQNNATVGAPVGTYVGDKKAEDLVADLGFNAQTVLEQMLRGDTFQAYLAARTLLGSKPINTVVAEYIKEFTDEKQATVDRFKMIGATATGPNGEITGIIIDADSIKSGTDGSLLVQRLSSLEGTVNGEDGVVSRVDDLREVIIDQTGTTVRAALKVVNGNVEGGFDLTNNQDIVDMGFVVDIFRVVDRNSGGPPQTVFLIEDGEVVIPTAKIRRLDVGVVTSNNIALNAVTKKYYFVENYGSGGANGTQVAPSGTFGAFGLTGRKLKIVTNILPIGAEVSIRLQLNGQQTGGNSDRTQVRLKRTSPGGAIDYLTTYMSGLSSVPAVVPYEWIDFAINAAGAYTYEIEMNRTAGEGNYFHAMFIVDSGVR